MKTIILVITLLGMSCSASCRSEAIKNTATDVVKCSLEFPSDVINHTILLVDMLEDNSEGFINDLIAWASSAKDTRFATCVLIAVKNHKKAQTAESSLTGASQVSELEAAVEKFRKERFGNLQFEP